jgi:hypothetical protein
MLGGGRVAVSLEATPRKAFASAVDWPGWARAGRTEEQALEALAAYAARYAAVADLAGEPFVPTTYETVIRMTGGAGTDFGIPSAITDLDRRPVAAAEAERRARLAEAAWVVFDRISAAAPAELRKGPRGGGRDRDKMIGHVTASDHAYAREVGHRGPEPEAHDQIAIRAERDGVLEILRRPSDGTALAGRTWTTRYAAHRIAWHALDHAWEMEDRAIPD